MMKPLQILIAFDQLVNTLFAGYADETISARAWRMHGEKRRWKFARAFIDTLFFWEDNHCYNAFISEQERSHMPERYSSESKKS